MKLNVRCPYCRDYAEVVPDETYAHYHEACRRWFRIKVTVVASELEAKE